MDLLTCTYHLEAIMETDEKEACSIARKDQDEIPGGSGKEPTHYDHKHRGQ